MADNRLDADLLPGAKPIAVFMFGDDSPKNVRRVRHAIRMGRIPVFKSGSILMGRKSTITKYLDEVEAASRANSRGEGPTSHSGPSGEAPASPSRRGRPRKSPVAA